MNNVIEATEQVVNIYRDNSKSQVIACAKAGDRFVVTEVSDDKQFYYSPYFEGWIDAANFRVITENSTMDAETTYVIKPDSRGVVDISDDDLVTGDTSSVQTNVGTLRAPDILGVFAMPYQFMPTVDRRVSDSGGADKDGVGRKYMDKIFARANLVYLTPGRQEFMPGASQSRKDSVLGGLTGLALGREPDLSESGILEGEGRYYSLDPQFSEYFRYVDVACAATANLIGIGDQRITIGDNTNVKIKDISWQKALSSNYKGLFGLKDNIVFYMDGFNQVTEGFSNSTRESSLESQVNGFSDTVKEINYIMNNNVKGGTLDKLTGGDSYYDTMSTIQSTVDNFTSGQGVLGAILGNATTVLSGGKLVFPELWSDSDYDRSYSIDIKLRSPDADDVSIFLNIIVPYIHLMALTAPRDMDGLANSNGYVAPFLVRAFSRSMFSIDMGIITDLSITKGGEGNWTTGSGLPTSVDVSLTIKDLYKSMYMTKATLNRNDSFFTKFIANDAEMEELMTLAGVQTQGISSERRWDILSAALGQGTRGVVRTPINKIREDISTFLMSRGLY